MFGFAKAPKDPLSDVKSAKLWADSFAASDPLAAHEALLAELARVAQPSADRRPAELEALFYADARAGRMRRRLIAQYIEHAPRSGKIEQQLWSALFDLTQGFLCAYAACERDLLEPGRDATWQALLPELLMRETMQLALDAEIRMFRYEPWIPAKWGELHQRFSLAASHGIEHQRLALAGEAAPLSIAQKYIATLMLQLCNAGNLDRAQLHWLAGELDDWCTQLSLASECPRPTAFYIDLAQRQGLRRRTAAPLEGAVLFLDTEPLHSLLQHYILAVEQKVRSEPLSAKTPRRIERLNLLAKIAGQVDPEFRPVPRRGERTAAIGRVDAIVGLAGISGYLHEVESAPVPELDTVGTYSGTLDLAVFGHLRNEEEQRKIRTRRRLEAFCAPGGPWEMKDVSLTGIRILAPMLAAGTLTLGMLVALRAEGELVWKLGIVRRMRRVTADTAEVGLQRIADSVAAVELRATRTAPDAGHDVEADALPRPGRPFRGLFLALQQGERRKVIQSLVLPAGEYKVGTRFRLQGTSMSYPVRFGPVIETQPEWVWAGVEALSSGERDPTAKVSAA